MDVKEDGKAGIMYWVHGLKVICPEERYDELMAILKGGTQKPHARNRLGNPKYGTRDFETLPRVGKRIKLDTSPTNMMLASTTWESAG
jgi:hypothetical protein